MGDIEGSAEHSIRPEMKRVLSTVGPSVKIGSFPKRRVLTETEREQQNLKSEQLAAEFNERNKHLRGGKNVSTRKHKKNKQHKSRKSNTNKQTRRKSIRRRRR